MYLGQTLCILVMSKCTRSYTEATLIILEALLNGMKKIEPNQLTFTCSKSTIVTLEKDAKYMFKVNNKETRKTSLTSL